MIRRKIAQGQLSEAIALFKAQPDPKSATFLISHLWKDKQD